MRDDRIYVFGGAVVAGGLAGARLLHVVDNWPLYAVRPETILAFWDGGTAVTGAFAGSSLAGLLAARALRLPLGFMFDISVIGIALGLAIGRLGDVINGEHHAIACDGLPWCVRYTHPATLGQDEPAHPVAAYDVLWDLVILAVTFVYWRRVRGRSPEGRVYWLHGALYGGGRALTQVLRVDPAVLGVQTAQLIGVTELVLGLVMLVVLTRAERKVA